MCFRTRLLLICYLGNYGAAVINKTKVTYTSISRKARSSLLAVETLPTKLDHRRELLAIPCGNCFSADRQCR